MLPRGPLGRVQLGNLRVYPHAEHPHEAQQPEKLDIARDEPQEQEGRVMAETMQSARRAVFAQARGGAAAAEIRAEARQAGPRLRHRQAQGRGRPRLDQDGRRQDHHQRSAGRDLFCPAGAAHDDPAAAGRRRTGRANTTSSARFRAAGFPARPARCVTACPRR